MLFRSISVDAPFFNRVNIPIGLFLMLLTGVGPLIAWRRSSPESLKRAFLKPLMAGVVVAVGLAIAGARSPYALISFLLCTFVAVTILIEFYKGGRAIAAKSGQNIIAAMAELTHRNTRRYGGYLVHMGVVFMFIGFTGKAFDQDKTVELAQGESVQLGRYTLTMQDLTTGQNDNYLWGKLKVAVSKNGENIGVIEPERRMYVVAQQGTSEVAIRRRLNEDLYINFAGTRESKAIIQEIGRAHV